MTGDQAVLCAKCGFANVPGDQFCGSCGAFLEWGGTPSDAAAAAPPASLPAIPATGAPGAPPSPPAPGPPAATLPPTQIPPQGAPSAPSADALPAAGGLLRCPACGIANPASRTFCQTCGATLTPTARIATRSRDEIAAAVASVPSVKPSPPRPSMPGQPAVAPARTAPKARGGLPGWILAVVVLGVLAGVAVVVGSQMLKGSGPASAASAAPSVVGSAPAGSSSAASAPASSIGGSLNPASPSASLAAGTSLKLTGASASSIAAGNTAKYGPQNAIDGSLKTSWQEGSPTEQGQWIEVSFDPATVTAVVIRDGFQASTALYKGNLRLKDITVSVDGGAGIPARLKDTTAAQRIDLPPAAGATRLRITIVSTYPSIKTSVGGTPFDDAAVSEIDVFGVKTP